MSAFNTTEIVIQSTAKYSAAESYALSTVSITLSVVSLGSCLFIIICWCLFKDLRKLAYGFVFYMAIATLVRQFAKTWGGHFDKQDPLCTIQGFLMIYGGLSTFYWIMSIALVMYTMIFHPFMWFQENTITKCNKISLVINFTIPLFFALLPVITESYGPTGGWCWIEGTTTLGKVFRWVSFYGQLVVILVFCIFAYCRIYFYLRWSKNAHKLQQTHKMYNRIKYYPLCLILGYSVAMTRRFIELWDVHLGFGWAMWTSVTTGLFGFFLLMVYGRLGKLNKLFKEKYKICIPICDSICCCLEKDDEKEQTPSQTTKTRTNAVIRNDKSKAEPPRPDRKSIVSPPPPTPSPPPPISTDNKPDQGINRVSIIVSPPPSPSPPHPDQRTGYVTPSGARSPRSTIDLTVGSNGSRPGTPTLPSTPQLKMSDTKTDVLKEIVRQRWTNKQTTS